MRIAVNAAFLGGPAEGMDTYTRSVIDSLSRSGHEILVYTADRVNVGRNGNGEAPVKARPTPAFLRAGSGSLATTLRVIPWTQTVLPLRLVRDRAQVLLSTVPEGMMVPTCPQVVVVHDLFPLFFPDIYPRWKHYFRCVLPVVLRASRRVIAVSDHTRQDLIRHLRVPGEKISVVHNWIDPLYFSGDPGSPPAGFEPGPYFLYVGRLSPYKNLEMVIRAFAAVRHDVREKLVCVIGFLNSGNSAYYSEILDLAARLGVGDRLQVYSGISRAELLYLYRNATALALLSKYEGFGYPPLEAMATGTPAIVSDSTALAEVAGPGAVCVPNTKPGPAAEAMERLANDPAYRAGLADAGTARAKEFSGGRGGELIGSILERCACASC